MRDYKHLLRKYSGRLSIGADKALEGHSIVHKQYVPLQCFFCCEPLSATGDADDDVEL